MCVGFFIALLDIQIVSASLGDIGGGLSAGPDEIAWVQTSYLIAEIIVIPLSGLAVARDVDALAVLRLRSRLHHHQPAVRLGLGHPEHDRVSRAAGISRRLDDPDRVHHRFRLSSPGSSASSQRPPSAPCPPWRPTLGPTIGGWITDNYSWHWLFFINLVPGVFVAIAVPMLVRIDRPNLALLRGADYLGMVLMALFLGCLEYTLEEGPRWDWFGDDTIRDDRLDRRRSPASRSSGAA